MSYHIIKRIRTEGGKVFITGADNNVWPRTPREWECASLSKILQEQGRDALDLEIMRTHEGGCFKSSSGKYARALKVLRHMPEYAAFDWRNNNYGWNTPESKAYDEKRKSAEFDALLLKAMQTRQPREKFIVTKDYFGTKVFLRSCRTFARWSREQAEAKIFRWKEDAEALKKYYQGGEHFAVEQLA